jgi:hypothetical protein
MALDVAGQAPARMSIANVSSGDSIEAQFNPTEFEKALEVNWARQTVPGLSHQPLQFVNTGNTKFTLELNFEAQDPTTELAQIHRARRFLQSLCYPRRGAGGGPPRALFVWPNVGRITQRTRGEAGGAGHRWGAALACHRFWCTTGTGALSRCRTQCAYLGLSTTVVAFLCVMEGNRG